MALFAEVGAVELTASVEVLCCQLQMLLAAAQVRSEKMLSVAAARFVKDHCWHEQVTVSEAEAEIC